MGKNYDKFLQLANKLGYAEFTSLQKEAFKMDDLSDPNRNIFIIGETSSGKTLIPILLYYVAFLKAKEEREKSPRMIFAVPYRALAEQKTLEIKNLFQEDICIVQSTGEYRQNDEEIQNGDVDIAVIITEKVYKYASRNSSFLSKYDIVVIDEAGLLSDSERGIRIDFILAWAYSLKLNCGKPKVIMLGTPFYNWEEYIEKYSFTKISMGGRPVELIKNHIIYHKNWGILQVQRNTPCVSRSRIMSQNYYSKMIEGYDVPKIKCEYYSGQDMGCDIRNITEGEKELYCPYISQKCKTPVIILPDECKNTRSYILSEICRYHLKREHQILIFWNNREEVRQMCKELYILLRDELSKSAEPEKCKRDILQACDVNEDDVYGILEDSTLNESEKYIYYKALASGIGFHSSAVPYEVRRYIEKNLLENTRLKIVCSTETLAFGVNSNVDVVIIANLMKQDGQEIRYLTLNEYQNYIGRAGRHSRQKTKNEGYAYTLIPKNQENKWKEITEGDSLPRRLYSLFFQGANNTIPLFILNLFTDESAKLSIDHLSQMIQMLPKPEEYVEASVNEIVWNAIKFLLDKKLIQQCRQHLQGRLKKDFQQKSYCLTSYGYQMKGYILGTSDYELLYKAIEEQTNRGIWQEIDILTLLYRLLVSKHAAGYLGGLYTNSEAQFNIREVYESLKNKYNGQDIPDWLLNVDITDENQEKFLYILAGLADWMDSVNPRDIFRKYKIHYSLLSNLAEQLAYLLEIGQVMLRYLLTEQWYERRELFKLFEGLGVDEEGLETEIKRKEKKMQKIYCSLYYGINTEVWTKLLEFLEKCGTEEAHIFADEISAARINPDTAKELRKVAVRYRFFAEPSRENNPDTEVRNNYINQRRQYRKDIRGMKKYYHHFFIETFEREYTESD